MTEEGTRKPLPVPTEYYVWTVRRGESKWYPLGQYDDERAAAKAALKKHARHLVSMRTMPSRTTDTPMLRWPLDEIKRLAA